MSQPLFNQLRASAMVNNTQAVGGGFHSSALAFQLPPLPPPPPPPPPPPNSALGTLVGAGFNQNHGNVRLNHYGGGGVSGNQPQQQQANQHGGSDYGKKTGSTYPSDTDRHLQYGFIGGTSVALSEAGEGQGQYVPIMTQAKSTNQGFQIDFYGQNGQSQQQQAGFGVGNQNDQNKNAFNEQQWKSPANMSHTGKGLDMVSNTATVWMGTGQPFRSREELYNPEEPTSDPKLYSGGGGVTSSFGAGMGGTKGFVGYHKQPLQGGEEILSTGGSVQLQPHQLNDFHAVTPPHLPHQCTICEKKVYNLKDWDQHVKGKLHLQNRLLYSEGATITAGAVHYGPAGSSEGCLNNVGVNNSMAYSSTANQDVSSGANLPAGVMRTYPMSGAGFTQLPPGSKLFPPRKSITGRVVHICNLPEGSCTENDVINLGLPFGKVTNYILMRSTHQAFVEMAYIEAAQAMVQYYQLTPATINDQKLLIRMSKRYKELQLKKPGKDVDSIIQDINSLRERDEMQEIDHYMPERARSRSPISRSLSPRSHSPSFTSCSSAHSPQGAPCRGGPERGSWTAKHMRKGDEDREREREREEVPWRNGGTVDDDRLNGRMQDRRNKPYLKPSDRDRISPRSADERGGGSGEGMRGGNRGGDWYPHPRGSPQGMPPFPSYRNMDEDSYKTQHVYKSEKPLRPQYQRHEEGRVMSKRREGGDYHRSRHSESKLGEESLPTRTGEDRRQRGVSPTRGRSKKPTMRHGTEKLEIEITENNGETAEDQRSKEKSVSPQRSGKHESEKDSEAEEWESGDDTEGECWYPKNMEELVTVDEVGEDDSIIEPDLPELQEHEDVSASDLHKDPTEEEEEEEEEGEAPRSTSTPSPRPCSEKELAQREDTKLGRGGGVGGVVDPTPTEEKDGEISTNPSPTDQSLPQPQPQLQSQPQPHPQLLIPVASEQISSDLDDFPNPEFKAALEETCLEAEVLKSGAPTQELVLTNHAGACESSKTQDVIHKMEDVGRELTVMEPDIQQHKAETPRVIQNSTHVPRPINLIDIRAPSPSREQEKIISEHSIPLGVEFIVPSTGFYCKLCGLFYTSEETAKTSHCRSTVHYRNLQKYLSQLAEESLLGALTDTSATE
ncbi:RNA-binding protein 20 isoform X2 [Salmo salar]|nr:RNA-binding protein 20 isoform X2 [Salmo salar]